MATINLHEQRFGTKMEPSEVSRAYKLIIVEIEPNFAYMGTGL